MKLTLDIFDRLSVDESMEVWYWVNEQGVDPHRCRGFELAQDGEIQSVRFEVYEKVFRFTVDTVEAAMVDAHWEREWSWVEVLKPSRPCPWPFKNLAEDVDECSPV